VTWNCAEDALPDKDGEYLVICKHWEFDWYERHVAKYTRSYGWFHQEIPSIEVTYWLDIPDFPNRPGQDAKRLGG
jgi:hypothetical protein